MPAHVVARVDELPPGERRIVEIEGRSIGVFNVGGEFFALRNRCPHQGGPLCLGRTSGFLIGEAPGDYRYSRAGEILRCPWHGWEFDLRTGQSWFDPRHTRVREYAVTVASGAALVGGGAGADADADGGAGADAEPPAPGLEPGPYTAELYPVTVEADYVVVDVSR